MSDTPFKWTCISCDKDISQDQEYCSECDEKRYRKIGGLLYLPLLNLLLIAYGYFTSLAVTLNAGLSTMGRIQASQSTYLFIAVAVNFILLLYIIYTASLFLRKKKELPLAYSVLIVVGIVIMLIDRGVTSWLFPEIPLNFSQVMPILTHVIYACIWIPYFRMSARAKKTFIR
ncbi:DUF2569 domain-containing protein [Enterobacter soli]|uniref:DUF2569 domain-containing protein n=1 Tax=Enterobacter soli TaxID=885040 RepID=A0AAW8HB47_9ENTR|nr:DUF2569 domain-containing protein [Enterobacter soli]MDD9243570.1 DUF2569 domain-containing protein [Enterobacter soli]MDQ2257618.1 DUF2569 domain-containing protein [Enterobacter soli]MDQ2337255.1 DUF2569 domain-containing protein [Enterobacter soli]HEE9788791.1 DUF2569 domain-containing protein [Enterobacter soli]